MMNEENKLTHKSFLGRGWSFPPEFNSYTGDVEMVADEKDIEQSLQIIISTSMKERVMRPRFGCNLKDFIFEPLDTSTKTYLRDIVETAIIYHEPRVNVNEIELRESEDTSNGTLYIEIDYEIRGTNSRYNSVFPYNQTEAQDAL